MAAERLQKFLARAGVASRRAAEQLIVKGRVRVDGRVVTELGVRVDARRAKVELDGRRLVAERFVYIVLHKPRGVVSTLSDPERRKTVADLLRGVGVRIVPVGRLDFHTSGVLLFTNDGDFASRLTHPRGGVPKEYIAKVRGALTDADLAKFRESIVIEGRATQPAQVRLDRVEGDKTWIELSLREGRNRQVRRLGEAAGFPVLRLARTAHAGITTHNLRPGQWRHLSQDELTELKRVYGVPKVIHAAFENPAPSRKPVIARSRSAGRKARSPARFGEIPAKAAEASGTAGRSPRSLASDRSRRDTSAPVKRSTQARGATSRALSSKSTARASARDERPRSTSAVPRRRKG